MLTLAITKPVCWHVNFVTLLTIFSFSWTHKNALVSFFRGHTYMIKINQVKVSKSFV